MRRILASLFVLLVSVFARAEAPAAGGASDFRTQAAAAFAAADALVDAGKFAAATQAFDKIRQDHPQYVWPRQQRHLEGYAYFRQEQLAKAEARWGALLCETHTDPLSFRIAYNLALAQERLGETERAYWTLQLVPGDTVLAQSPMAQQAYFDLAGIVAEKKGKFAVAAQVQLAAYQILRAPAAKLAAARKFQKAAAQIQDPDEWKALEPQVKIPSLHAFLIAHKPSAKAKPRELASGGATDGKIAGLKMAAYRVHDVDLIGVAQASHRLLVAGRYQEPGKILICGGAPVALDTHGRFKLDLEIVNGNASAFLLAMNEGGPAEHQIEQYAMADWKPSPIDADLVDEDDATPARSDGAWHWLGIGLSARVAMQQSGDQHIVFPMVQWTPAVDLSEHWQFRAEFGGFESKKITGGNFVGLDYRGLLDYRAWNAVVLEAGGGAQTWLSYGGTFAEAAGGLGLILDAGVLDSLMLGGDVLFDPRHTKVASATLRFVF